MATQTVHPADVRAAPLAEETFSYVHWGPIIAGALAAAALALVMHSFAAAIGLSVSSTAPTWRDASLALVGLSGLWMTLFYPGARRCCGDVTTSTILSAWA